MNKINIDDLKDFLSTELQSVPIIDRLDKIIADKSSKAGTRHEEVFTRHFLCPAIGKYFYEHVRLELNLSDDAIKEGLGTEGYTNCHGFGFTPARKGKYLLTKFQVIDSTPPSSWYKKIKQI